MDGLWNLLSVLRKFSSNADDNLKKTIRMPGKQAGSLWRNTPHGGASLVHLSSLTGSLTFRNHVHKPVEKVVAILWTGACFGVVLD